MGVFIPEATIEQCVKFEQYLSLLLKWNKVHNLTAIRDTENVVKRHFLESLAIIPHLGSSRTILDLGTGAGFPGIPLAIMRPTWQVTVLDSAHKKIAFCQEVVRVCNLRYVRVILSRAEAPSIVHKLGRFDAVVSRATWSLAEFLPMALPYLHIPDGIIVAMKRPRHWEELAEIPPLPPYLKGPEICPLSTEGESSCKLVMIKYWA